MSTNNGTNWTNYTTTNGLGSNTVYGVYASGGTIYAATYGGGLSIGVTAVPGTGLAGLAMLGFAGVARRRRCVGAFSRIDPTRLPTTRPSAGAKARTPWID